jgi:hypothetical protein
MEWGPGVTPVVVPAAAQSQRQRRGHRVIADGQVGSGDGSARFEVEQMQPVDIDADP